MTTRIKLRRDTAANWTENNPILALGEPGLETDTNQIKYGDGETAWNLLDYAGTSIADSNETVFAALGSNSDLTTAKSTNGTNWTAPNSFWLNLQQGLEYGGTVNAWGTNMIDMAVGNGCVVYVDWSPWDNQSGLWRATSLEAYPTKQTVTMTLSDFAIPVFEYWGIKYLGGYFIAYGMSYDADGAYHPTPIFAYSADGITWTQGAVNKTYTDGIYTTANGNNGSIDGIGITDVAYNGTGWLFNLDYAYDGGTLYGESAPGGFYVTSLSATLGAANFDDVPSVNTASEFGGTLTWTGSRWLIADSARDNDTGTDRSYIWYNTSADPRDSTWTGINMEPIILSKFGYDYSDMWSTGANPVLCIASGTIGSTTWTVMGTGEGQLLSTSNFSTWYGITPKPISYSIGSYTWTDPGTEITVNWDSNSVVGETGISQYQVAYEGKVTISTVPGETSVITPGTYYASNINAGPTSTFTLYTDEARTTPVDTSSGWGAYTSGQSIITLHRGYEGIQRVILENSTIVAANFEGAILKSGVGNLSQAFTEVKPADGTNIQRLTYGTITRLGNSWESTHAATGRVNKVALSDYEFKVLAADTNTDTEIRASAAGWELSTRTPFNEAYQGGEFGGSSIVSSDAYVGIYNDDWLGEGDGPNLDIVLDVSEATHLFDRYGNIRLGGPIIYTRNYSNNNPPIDGAVDNTNFTTAAANIRNLRNSDPQQTNGEEGWPNIVFIDSVANNNTSVHHYYLPPAPRDGMEITFVGHGNNIGNVAVWVQSGQAGTNTLTNTIWYPFVIYGGGGNHLRTIAKAIYYSGTWYFDGNAWPD